MLGVDPDPGGGDPVEGVCRSCHKEKGLGSPLPKGGHPVNLYVARPLPGVYPLSGAKAGNNAGGTLTCATCHDVHGTGFVPVGQGAGKLLRRIADGPGDGNPDRNGECLPCHKATGTHAKSDCASCHPPHKSSPPDEGCTGCHAKGKQGTAGRHITTKRGCLTCHKIHPKGGAEQKPDDRLCLGCHSKEERIVGTGHSELEGGVCGACHPAHKDLEPVNIKRRAYEESFLPNLPCLRCHREGGPGPIAKEMDHPTRKKMVPTNYGETVTLESNITMVGRFQESGRPVFPLFDDAGKAGMSGRVGCLTCHDPHASVMKSGKEERTSSGYLRDSSDNFIGEICASCHRGEAVEHVRKFHVLPRKQGE
jgi:hypothetical protein